MRIVTAEPVPARPMSIPAARAHASPGAIVGAALMLALLFLAFRIFSGLVAGI
jgi:hypothetical protein